VDMAESTPGRLPKKLRHRRVKDRLESYQYTVFFLQMCDIPNAGKTSFCVSEKNSGCV